ncbi:MAG: aminopeptidase P family protein [Deinococcus sp.]|nr:aminopeptidase P family protein [Deinococcus sp.]
MDYQGRARRVQELVRQRQLDGLWVSRPENVRYLSGFTAPADGRVLVTMDRARLFTDARYTVQAQQEVTIETIIWGGDERLLAVAEVLPRPWRLGCEADAITVADKAHWERVTGLALWPQEPLIEELRLVKEPSEIELISRAAQVTDQALYRLLEKAEPGRRERELALELEWTMRQQGAQGAAFQIIVASGERGAMPHGVASARQIQRDELVTFDLGAIVQGYHSDLTRTYAFGQPSRHLAEVFDIVREAQQAGVQAVRPGATGAEIDAVCRSMIERAGYGEYFAHSTGHGVGLAIHEAPRLGRKSPAVLQPGMVITVEPGIYLPGEGGVRIEDLLLVTEHGAQVLSHSPRGLYPQEQP